MNTTGCSPTDCTAARGTTICRRAAAPGSAMFTYIPRRRRPSGFGTSTLTLTVRDWRYPDAPLIQALRCVEYASS
jgi:hypothetical protein